VRLWRTLHGRLLRRDVGRPGLPGNGAPFVQGHFLFLAVLGVDGKSLAEEVGTENLHGPLAGLILLADLGAAALELLVGALLIGQAAEQPAAHAGNLRRVQKEILLLGHLDGHRLELADESGAAAHLSAVAYGTNHLGFVADANLAELDAGAVRFDQVLHQLPEVDAPRCREEEDHLGTVLKNLHIHELHVQVALADALAAVADGFPGQIAVFGVLDHVFGVRGAVNGL